MVMKTPEKQILPIAPTFGDFQTLSRWAGDLTRTLQQNLSGIARKANDENTFTPIADLDMGAFNITNVGAITAVTGNFTDVHITGVGANDERLVRTDGTTGDLQGSSVILTDADALSGITTLNMSGLLTLTGGQINFPATQIASGNVNTLDDYERGGWTPGISFNNGVTGLTYTLNVGGYTKIGNTYHAWGVIILSAKGSSTGQARITGLPFTSLAFSGGVVIEFFSNMAALVDGIFGVVAGTSGTTADLRTGGAANMVGMTDAHFTNTSNLWFAITATI